MTSLVNVGGKDIAVEGRLLRIARLAAEKYEFIDAPEPTINALRGCGSRIDLFTFMQRVAAPSQVAAARVRITSEGPRESPARPQKSLESSKGCV